MTKRILLRAGKSAFDVISPEKTLAENQLGSNVGNLLFSHAAQRALETEGTEVVAAGMNEPDRKARWWSVGTRAPNGWLSRSRADEVNAEFDAVVIPLANAFRLSYERYLVPLTEFICKLKIPVVVLGVGAQGNLDYGYSRLQRIEPSVKAFVSAVLDRSASIGVRGEFSADYLSTLGFKDVEVIGCPSMFLNGTRLHVAKKVSKLDVDSKVTINISPYVTRMGKVLKRHLKLHPKLTYLAQDNDTLQRLLEGDPADAPQKDIDSLVPLHTSHPVFQEKRVRCFVDAGTWLDYLAERDFCFGTRIHGNIASLIAGTPGYVLAHDSRTLELARYFDIPHARLDKIKRVDAVRLHEEADYSRLNDGHAARFETYVQFLEKNGLDHIWSSGSERSRFDERLSAIRFPGLLGA